jgi:hypothetical protein
VNVKGKAVPLSVLLLAGILLGGLILLLRPLLGEPWVFRRCTDIDLNSGGTRDVAYVFSLCVKNRIQESDLSREVRRLGIDVPGTRVWKRAFESYLVEGVYIDYSYGGVVATCGQLLRILDLTEASDQERRVALEMLLTSLRTGDPRQTQDQLHLLMDEIGGRHGLEVFDNPELKEHLKTLRKQREAQAAVP